VRRLPRHRNDIRRGSIFVGIGCIGFVVILFGAVMIMTNPLVNVAEEYFLLISENRIDEAFDTLLKQYYDASWYSRSREGDRGVLEGTVTTTDAVYDEVNVIVQLVKENGEWKIYSLDVQ
jgi:hypothetical protein